MKLTEWTSCGGCAAKWGGAPLSALLRQLGGSTDPALLLGLAPFDERFPVEAAAVIMAAAAEVVRQAGGTVAGGHTIRSEEPIFGLAVQGLVHPGRVWSKAGALPGDRLVLSKPIGTGIVLGGGTEAAKATVIAGMRRLNRDAAA